MRLEQLSIKNIKPLGIISRKFVSFGQVRDSFGCENPNIDKKPLISRKILKENQDVNSFFDSISSQIFPDSDILKHGFSNLLKGGYISLSSSAYCDIVSPTSAIGLSLDSKKPIAAHLLALEEYIKNGVGVGINFSNFENPIDSIKQINSYFKYKEPSLRRPAAGIALLNITHPKILDFIALKNSKDYENWCFDLSVVIDDDFLSKVDRGEDITLDNGLKIPSKDLYLKLLDSMTKTGEPGVIFSPDKNFICDSCAAAKLKDKEELKLAHINLSKFYNPKTKKIDYPLLSWSANILSLAQKAYAPDSYIGILGYSDLLDKQGLTYGSNEALNILENCLKIIKAQSSAHGIKMAISPTGTISRILKTTPSLEPKKNQQTTYKGEIDTMARAQKYLEGGISKTIILKKDAKKEDTDYIIRYAKENNIKGISVFPS